MVKLKKMLRALIYISGTLTLISLFLSLILNDMIPFTIMTCLFFIFTFIYIILMVIKVNDEIDMIGYVDKRLYQHAKDFKIVKGLKNKLFNGSYTIIYFLLIPMLVIGMIFIVLLTIQMIINII